MNNSYIPEGFQTVSPYFIVENAPAFIDFLGKAFDAKLVFIHREEDVVVYCRVQIGTSLIELSEAKPAFPAMQMSMQLFVEDCDKTYQKAIDAGSISIGEPENTPYGLRAGYITDAWGNQWYISTQIENKYSPAYWESNQ